MKSLLRSTFIAGPMDNKDLLFRNFLALQEAGLEFDVAEDSVIWAFVREFARTHNHVPDVATIQGHFATLGEDTVTNRVTVLAVLPAYVQGDFISRLNDRADERRLRAISGILKDTGTIVSSGLEIRQGRDKIHLRGPMDAVRYFLDKSHDIVAPTLGARLSGEVTRDGTDFVAEYERVESDPLAGIGQHTGIHQMDTALNGAKRYELWIHAAFTGHGKSTLMLNWAYNQAIWYGHDNLIFSLEMPYQQCRRILYAIHSQHDKFKETRHKLGLQSGPTASTGLPYSHIRDGTLHLWHPNARQFLMDYVIPDFNGDQVVTGDDPNTGEPWMHPKNYGKVYIEVADPDKTDFTVADLRHRAELIYAKTPFAMIFVDHVGLMAPRKWVASTTERLNEIIRDTKRLAMAFNRGQGIAVVALFQINREGFKSAMKAKEKGGTARYDLVHLSYANEAERSADVVTASWIDDDLMKANRIQHQCLKSRDQKPFETFVARMEWPCRRMITCTDLPISMSQKESLGAEIDKIGLKLDAD